MIEKGHMMHEDNLKKEKTLGCCCFCKEESVNLYVTKGVYGSPFWRDCMHHYWFAICEKCGKHTSTTVLLEQDFEKHKEYLLLGKLWYDQEIEN